MTVQFEPIRLKVHPVTFPSLVPVVADWRVQCTLDRFFHDGVRLRAEKVTSVLLKLRQLSRLHDDCCEYTSDDSARESNDDNDVDPTPQRSIRGNRKSRRPGQRQQRESQQHHRQASDSLLSKIRPSTIMIAYDSFVSAASDSTDTRLLRRDGAGNEDAETIESGAADISQPSRGRYAERESSWRPATSPDARGKGQARGREDGAGARGRGGGKGVEVRVVQLKRAQHNRSGEEDSVRRGFDQVGHLTGPAVCSQRLA